MIENVYFSVNFIGSIERSICECDHKLALTLKEYEAPDKKYQDYPLKNCVQKNNGPNELPSCCLSTEGLFHFYFGDKRCCENGGVFPIGECLVDEGRPYEAKITLTRPGYIHVGDADGKDNSDSNNTDSGETDGKGKNPNKDPNKWNTGSNELEGNMG